MNLFSFLTQGMRWSNNTFGRTENRRVRLGCVLEHIESEIEEIRKDPCSLEEWCDLVILGLEGAMRAGWTPHEICQQLEAKQAKNMARTWEAKTSEGKVSYHVKGGAE